MDNWRRSWSFRERVALNYGLRLHDFWVSGGSEDKAIESTFMELI
jgi:hypothetical protein